MFEGYTKFVRVHQKIVNIKNRRKILKHILTGKRRYKDVVWALLRCQNLKTMSL